MSDEAITAAPRAPVVVGRYALYDEIASGGMATVHIGRLIGPVGFSRTVAIKRMHGNLAKNPEFVTMFLDEARLAARIRHPNVIGTLDVVALSGELFLVMEYVHGESLHSLMKGARSQGHRIPLPVVSAVIVGVLEGLHAAHEATNERGERLGIVHRDVSPHNVIVGASDGLARVLDFGIAKAADRMTSTRDGEIKGKLSYMAPEQLASEAVDRTSDVYSASVILWECLTGTQLLPNEGGLQAMVTKALQLKPEPPSKHRPDVSPDLDRLVLRGLAQEPTERIRTARELAQELRRLVPPAASSEVAEWVDQIAGPVIVERAQRVAAIEQTLPSDVHATVPPPASEPQGTRKTGADGTVPTMTLGAIVRHFDASRVRYVALVTGALTALAVVLAMRARGAPAANRAGTDGGALASVPAPKLPAAGAGVEQQPLAPPAVPAPTAMPRTADVAADAGAAAAASPPRRAQPAAVRPSHPRADEFEHVMDSRK